MTINGFTKTERAILTLLSDGEPHDREGIHQCLSPDSDIKTAVKFHIANLRTKLQPHRHAIICEFARRRIFYRHVCLLPAKTPPPKGQENGRTSKG